MAERAWVGISSTYKCIDCEEYVVSLFISYGEPAVFEYPLVCPLHWKRDLKSAIETILKTDVPEEVKTQLIARLLDFIEAR